MHHQGHETTEVGDDHFRSTGVKLWVTVAAVLKRFLLGLKTRVSYSWHTDAKKLNVATIFLYQKAHFLRF